MRAILFLVVLAVVPGCHSRMQPIVAYGSPVSVQVDRLTPRNEARGFALAEAHCARYGKVPRIVSDQGRRITFDCVAP